jgi:hypothetical protein
VFNGITSGLNVKSRRDAEGVQGVCGFELDQTSS